MIEVIKYYRHPNADYAGNPLIECIPHITSSKMRTALSSSPRCLPDERWHAPELRMQYVTRLKELFLPLEEQVNLALLIWNAILHSYKRRNPKAVGAAKAFYDMCGFFEGGADAVLAPNSQLATPSYILLIGTPGTGKTRTIDALFSRLPQDLLYHKKTGIYQLLSVKISAPGNGRDNKTLAWALYSTLYEIAKKHGIPIPKVGPTASTAVIRRAACDAAQALHLGVLIVDEVQHAFRGTLGFDNETMKFLTDLVNEFSIPIILIGTWKLAAASTMELRLGRRFVTPESVKFRKMPCDEVFEVFLEGIFRSQYLPTFTSLNPGLVQEFYKHTLGVQDLVVKLMMMVQLRAIRDGLESITPTLVASVAEEELALVAPAIRMMRDGVKETDPILWDIEPVNFDAYLEAVLANASLESAGRKFGASLGAQATTRRAIKRALVAAELASEEVAEVVAANAVEQYPGRGTAEHLVKVLLPGTKRAPRLSNSNRSSEAANAAFEAMDDADIRKIVYRAKNGSRKFAEGLTDAGYIPSISEDIAL